MPQEPRHGEPKKWLKTSEGWVRAQLLLATLQEPPKRGSLRELLLRLFIMMREEAEFLKHRALVVMLVDKKQGGEAFDEYLKAAFPYLEVEKNREKSAVLEMLQKEVSRGPLAIKKVSAPNVRSRLHANHARSDKVLARIGPSIPLGDMANGKRRG